MDQQNEQASARLKEPRPRKGRENASGGIDPFYIIATSPLADRLSRVLKQDDTFAIFDQYGDIRPVGLGEEGLFFEGTRFLSTLILTMAGEHPLLLSSNVKRDNQLLAVDLTNPDIRRNDRVEIPRGTLHIYRTKFLWQGTCYEHVRIRNYGLSPITISLALYLEADFADIFEVRGTKRKQRGEYLPDEVTGDAITLSYQGLDAIRRRTRVQFSPRPDTLTDGEVCYNLILEPKGERSFTFTASCEIADATTEILSYEDALLAMGSEQKYVRADACDVATSNETFNNWLNRSVADLHMMTTHTPGGPYPYAGVPWFSTVFGRDGIITAFECLWIEPEIARGVLSYLAATQATELIPEQDAEPGKILHEMRHGEMADLREIPFGKYYGSIDSTPLFIVLAGAYYERTGDRDFIRTIWGNIERALSWMSTYGDRDGDGFIEYIRRSPNGLVQQGWKDSYDSVFHAEGSLAPPPIALCEVQGYAYAAKRCAAALAAVLGETDRAHMLEEEAEQLRKQFEETFWCEDLSTYALALDGSKKPCRIRSSNAGQCLLSGIASKEHARRVANTLLSEDGFSGWGIRTIAASEARYNPMSYHNGSIWPHDNALIAYGMGNYGLKKQAVKILTGLFDASLFVELHRLPELFCGFTRRAGEGPTLYPVACSPQAWSTAAIFVLIQACLGLSVRGAEQQIRFAYPILPEFLRELRIHNLKVGSATTDLLLVRHGQDVGINVLRRDGNVEIIMVK